MNIMWNHLDEQRATVVALKDYDGMKFVIDSYQDDLKLVKGQMIGVSSPHCDFVPSSSKKNSPTGYRLLYGIDETTKLNGHCQQAQLYFKWFEPAWQELSEDERFVLDIYYRTPDQLTDEGLTIVMDKYFTAKTITYNRKDKALGRLTFLLYGSYH